MESRDSRMRLGLSTLPVSVTSALPVLKKGKGERESIEFSVIKS